MRKICAVFIGLLIMSLFLIGCAQRVEQPLEKTGESSVDEVSSEITDVDSVDTDLELGDLESMDQDLANLDW